MTAFRPLAEGFPQAGEAEWRLLAERGKAGSLSCLTSTTIDGLTIAPIHPAGHGPVLPMRPAGAPWSIVQRIERGGADAVREAIDAALRGGATGIELVFASGSATHGRGGIEPGIDLSDLISGLDVPVRLDAGEKTPRLAVEMAPSGPPIVPDYDPATTMAALGGLAHPIEQSAADIATLIEAMDLSSRSGSAFTADGRRWHDGGASEVQELAAVLASAVASLRLLAAQGVETGSAARRLAVALSADTDQFVTIAKFRAVRLLFARLAEVSGLDALRPPVHAETAWRMLCRREPTMNMVRATTAAFAAAAGGADSVTVLSPHLEGEAFNARMARNTQTILLDESSLSRSSDPGAGAGAVEALTAELAAAAWALFTRIEGEGGLVAVVGSGSIQRAVAAMRDSRIEKVARRQIPLIGVNVNAGPVPAAVIEPTAPGIIERTDIEPLRPVRLAEPFENLCARSVDRDGRRRRVLLVRLGRGEDPASSADAFAAGGFEVISFDPNRPSASLAEAFASSGARVACVVIGADGREAAIEAARSLRAVGAKALVAAGLASTALPHGAFDAVLSAETDLVALLFDVLDRIAEPDENGQS